MYCGFRADYCLAVNVFSREKGAKNTQTLRKRVVRSVLFGTRTIKSSKVTCEQCDDLIKKRI
jgi:hypothetical protein